MSIQPYRSESKSTAIVVVETAPKQLYGFIQAEAPHKCELPGSWARFFRGLNRGTLFRCSCGNTWMWGYRIWGSGISPDNYLSWHKVSIEKWIEAGGAE